MTITTTVRRLVVILMKADDLSHYERQILVTMQEIGATERIVVDYSSWLAARNRDLPDEHEENILENIVNAVHMATIDGPKLEMTKEVLASIMGALVDPAVAAMSDYVQKAVIEQAKENGRYVRLLGSAGHSIAA